MHESITPILRHVPMKGAFNDLPPAVMDHVIYTASLLRAFRPAMVLATTAFLFGIVLVLLTRDKTDTRLARIGVRVLAILFLGVGSIETAILVSDVMAGPHHLIFTAGSKKVTTSQTKNRETHTYIVRPDRPLLATFSVPERLYDQIVLDGCYHFTYYGDVYEGLTPIESITEIRQLDPQRCAADF